MQEGIGPEGAEYSAMHTNGLPTITPPSESRKRIFNAAMSHLILSVKPYISKLGHLPKPVSEAVTKSSQENSDSCEI